MFSFVANTKKAQELLRIAKMRKVDNSLKTATANAATALNEVTKTLMAVQRQIGRVCDLGSQELNKTEALTTVEEFQNHQQLRATYIKLLEASVEIAKINDGLLECEFSKELRKKHGV